MDVSDLNLYFNGMAVAIYFITCLVCGLQLRFDIFGVNRLSNVVISKSVGLALLVMSLGSLCYILSTVSDSMAFWEIIGNVVDLGMMIMICGVGHIICCDEKPSLRSQILVALPFAVIAVLYFLDKPFSKYLPDVSMLVVVSQFVYYWFLTSRREKMLDNLYSDPDSHSLSWIKGIIAFLIGWWVVRIIFSLPPLCDWYCVAMYCYMTVFVLFSYSKILNYREPVAPETIKEIASMDLHPEELHQEASSSLRNELINLLEVEKVYLNPGLTVEDVVKRLGANPKYFSAMLHNEMNVTFCQLVNDYRVERAKELLTNTEDKVSSVAFMSGFNSIQSFYRVFAKSTGMKPIEWRNKK